MPPIDFYDPLDELVPEFSKSITDKFLADIFRMDEAALLGNTANTANANTTQAQDEISFSKVMESFQSLKAKLLPRRIFIMDPVTASQLPDEVMRSRDTFILPPAYQVMLPRQWRRRKFHPPYRKPALRPRWVSTPKGIFSIDAPRSVFK